MITSTQLNLGKRGRLALCMAFAACQTLCAETSIPVGNAPLQANVSGPHLEIEQIEIGRNAAYPNAIHRHPGKFILMLSDPRGLGLSFVITKAPTSTANENAPPLLTLDQRFPIVAHRRAALLDLSTGEYQLKSPSTGQVYCSITID